MSLQLPKGYVPTCIAPLFVVARTLQGHAPVAGPRTLNISSLGIYGSSLITVPGRGRRVSYNLVVREVAASHIGVELVLEARDIPQPEPRLLPRPRIPVPMRAPEPQPGEVAVAEIEAADEDDGDVEGEDAFAEPPRPFQPLRCPATISVTLVPPYRSALLSEHLSASARALGLAGLARPLPKGVSVSFPSMADMLGAELREILIEGGGSAALVDERTGTLIDIPPGFWRTDAAGVALASDEMVTMISPQAGEVRGRACIGPRQLEAAWLAVHERLFGPAPVQVPPLRTPGIILLERVAHELSYVNGAPERWHLKLDHIAAWVQVSWNADELGPYRQGMGTAAARLIALPQHLRVGAPNAARTAQWVEWERIYAERAGREYAAVENR
ncbi:hypothetical protein [Methylobacterium goesingense]|uniref:Uncharacterized protein n=1 Tax=Methylobacterium goesingense TaxID=243690 RepID=A0ABV2LF43_9HYPH|nr:hypothetical protein [Methylobacterium goesingense]GJD73595.1 hypothetical protein CFIICLFH_1824 [Methylobacterium goesingense]